MNGWIQKVRVREREREKEIDFAFFYLSLIFETFVIARLVEKQSSFVFGNEFLWFKEKLLTK